jgi:hypothetical protein
MVGQGEPFADKTTEEIAREAEAEVARSSWLAREADKAAGKRHHSRQDDSVSSDKEAGDDAPSLRHHTKFNRQCPVGRERLWDLSRTIFEELDRIEF